MQEIKIDKDKRLCMLAVVIIVASYGVERLIEIFSTPTKAFALLLGAMYIVLAIIVFLILLDSKSPFFGLLASLLGYKMMPPSIAMLTQKSLYGEEAYYLACKAATILFVVLIIRFYYLQGEQRNIRAMPILAIMFVIPFFTEIGQNTFSFSYAKTGGLMLYYISTFICYIIASFIILAIAYHSGYESMRFTAYFEFTVLGVNALKRIGAIVANVSMHQHISRSYYVWVAIYVALALCFYIAKQKKAKE